MSRIRDIQNPTDNFLEHADLRNVEKLILSNGTLTRITYLPPILQELDCDHNQIIELPEILPPGLTYFNCSFNNLTSLPDLPNSLLEFNCQDNLLKVY